MHLTAPLHWSRSIGTNGRDPSELVVTIAGMRSPCGCLHVSYVFHRELRSTYGLSFDPRNFDQTRPYYYFGALRAYPRYWIAEPLQ